MSKRPQFVLHLEAEPRDADPTGNQRMRRLLKAVLRSFGFRCRKIEFPEENAAVEAEKTVLPDLVSTTRPT